VLNLCRCCWQLLPRNYRIHRHCFTGNWRDGQLWLHKFPSSYIGVTPLVTQRGGRATAVRDFVTHVPLDKLLLETDSPYFVPHEVSMSAYSWRYGAVVYSLADCHSVQEKFVKCLLTLVIMIKRNFIHAFNSNAVTKVHASTSYYDSLEKERLLVNV